MIKYFFVFLFCSFSFVLFSQQPAAIQAAAQAELVKRGIPEAEMRSKLLERGIDIDNVPPDRLASLQPTIEAVIREIEAERAQAAKEAATETAEKVIDKEVKQSTAEINQEIKEKVDDGASVQEAVSETLSDKLEESIPPSNIYGQQIFRDQSLSVYRTTNDVKPPDTYILNAGDELTISIFGASAFDGKYEINKDGYIQPSQMPKIFLKGLTLKQGKKLLQSRFSYFYRFNTEQFAVSLTTARTITVNIFGETKTAGSFTISAVNTAFNALVAAGGPSDIGTVRNIKVTNGGKTKQLDVYEFLYNPSVQYDFYLEDNAIIHVPVSERVVTIQGAITRPLRYELIKGEELYKLIEYAGGFKPNAYREVLQIQRFAKDKKILIDVPLQNLLLQNKDFTLENGDVITVRTYDGEIEDFVEIDGPLLYPGRYSLLETPKLSDLLSKATFKKETRRDLGFLMRRNPDNSSKLIQINPAEALDNKGTSSDFTLQAKDRILLYTLERFTNRYSISVNGAVRNPLDDFPYDSDSTITVQQAILLAGGLKPDANGKAYIVRTNPNNTKEKTYLQVDVQAALSDPNNVNNMRLQPMDRLSLQSKLTFTDEYTVSTVGAVRNPNTFAYSPSLTFSDVINMSGGLEVSAYSKAYIIRKNPANQKEKTYLQIDIDKALSNPNGGENVQLLPLDQVRVLSGPAFTDEFSVTISGAVREPGTFDYAPTLELRDLLTMAGGFRLGAALDRIDIFRLEFNGNEATRTSVGTFEVDSSFELKGSTSLVLQPFDQIVVRSIPEFELLRYIEINGEVIYPGRYALLNDNETISSVMERAGGLTKEAQIEASTLFRTDKGKGLIVADFKKALKNNNSADNHILIAGDVITVPKREDLVTVMVGNTRAKELYSERFLTKDQINVAFKSGKRARWYIKKYALGFGENASKKRVTVHYPSGKLTRTKNFYLFKIYPKVEKGSSIAVGAKPKDVEKENTPKEPKKPVDWDKAFTQILAVASTTATLIIAIAALNRN